MNGKGNLPENLEIRENWRKKPIHQSELGDYDLSGCTIVFIYRTTELSMVALILPFSDFQALLGAYFSKEFIE